MKYFLLLIPKNRKLILFNAWFGDKYADNTKYVYEYLLSSEKYNVIWYTKNPSVYQQLKAENKPVVMSQSLKGMWYQVRAKMLVSTVQLSDYNPYLLSNCIFLDLGHGHVIKDAGFDEKSSYLYRLCKEMTKYYMIVTSDYSKQNALEEFHTTDEQIFISDFARNDVFFDSTLRLGVNKQIEKVISGRRSIVYMPTHRSDGNVPLKIQAILDLDAIQALCEKTNSIFIIKKHYYHRNEQEKLESYPNIFDVSQDASIDSQVLLFQADILITDYSAVYIDYLLLDRPIIFYHWDLEYFNKKERSIKIPFGNIEVGPKPQTKEQLNDVLKNILTHHEEDVFYKKRREWSKVYFNDFQQTPFGRKKVADIIDDLLER